MKDTKEVTDKSLEKQLLFCCTEKKKKKNSETLVCTAQPLRGKERDCHTSLYKHETFQAMNYFLPQPQTGTSFNMITMMFRSIRGSLINWQACTSPIICPLSEFLVLPWSSASVHPLGARNLSSFSMANAFAKSRIPSREVQKPIICKIPRFIF